jgi:hypothetical protein
MPQKKISESDESGEWSGVKGLPIRIGQRVEIVLVVMSPLWHRNV